MSLSKNRVYVWMTVLVLILAGAGFYLLRSNRSSSETQRFPVKPNILLITVDTTRADHLPAYGYTGVRTPNLDSLAQKGILFRDCAGTSPLTLPAHSSIMTGSYPTYHGVRINGNTALSTEHVTLAEAFAANHYETGAFIGAFVLDGRWGLNQGFQHYDDRFDLNKFKKLDLGLVQRPGNEVVDAALGWLEQHKQNSFFAWVHLYDPHVPYAPPEPYRTEYGSKGIVGLYDGEIAFMDEQIGRCIKWLDQNNLRDRTIIAVIGDHGEGLGDHGEMTHGYFIYDYAVHVPFILSTPHDWNGLKISTQVRSIDLYPTLLEASGIPIPKQVQGTSLWSVIKNGGGEDFFAYSESMSPSLQYGWSPLIGLRTSKYKYIDAPRPEFYDIAKDPGEQNDIRQRSASIADQYEKRLKSVVTESSAGAPDATIANLDSETLERLAALGYIGTTASTKSSNAGMLVDPKDRLDVYEAIQKAGELSNNDENAKAAEILEHVLQKDPLNPQARLLLAGSYEELNRLPEAGRLLQALLDEDPKNIRALVSLANVLQDEGKPDEVIALCKNVLKIDERNTQALAMMGQAYISMRKYSDAVQWLQKAVDVQPKLTQNQMNLAECRIGLKEYDDARTVLNAIVADNPKFPKAHYHLGLLHENQGKLQEAIAEYQREIENYDNCFVARFNLGRLLLRMGDHAGYMEQMREVIRVAPKNPAGYLFLARGLLQENGNNEEILALTDQGLSLARSPEYKAMAYFLLADAYNRLKQPQQVQLALSKANQFKAEIKNHD